MLKRLVEAKLLDSPSADKIGQAYSDRAEVYEVLINQAGVSETELIKLYAQSFDLPLCCLMKENLAPGAQDLLPHEIAKRYRILPLKKTDSGILVAMAPPLDLLGEYFLNFNCPSPVIRVLTTSRRLFQIIEAAYSGLEAPPPSEEERELPDLEESLARYAVKQRAALSIDNCYHVGLDSERPGDSINANQFGIASQSLGEDKGRLSIPLEGLPGLAMLGRRLEADTLVLNCCQGQVQISFASQGQRCRLDDVRARDFLSDYSAISHSS